MMRNALLAIVLVCVPAALAAQPVGAGDSVLWDIQAPDLATAQGYTYTHYDDGATAGMAYAGVTCVTTTTAQLFTCSALFGAYTPGAHTLTLTAKNPFGESMKSLALSFSFGTAPNVPVNLRIGRKVG